MSENSSLEQKPVKLKFPSMLRKMWSGGEVQEWLDKQQPLYSRPLLEDKDTQTPDTDKDKRESPLPSSASPIDSDPSDIATKKQEKNDHTNIMTNYQALYEEELKTNARLDTLLNIDSDIISDQVRRIQWLEYMIWAAANFDSSEDVIIWKDQVDGVIKTVDSKTVYSDDLPVFRKEWYGIE
jgi:hypothetical protein